MSAPAKLPRTRLGRLLPFSDWREVAFWLMVLGLAISSIGERMGWIDDGVQSALLAATVAAACAIRLFLPYLPAFTVSRKLGPLDRLQVHEDA